MNTQTRALLLCALLTAGFASSGAAQAEPTHLIAAARINQAVISRLSQKGVSQPKIISHLDLTKPFHTADQWTLVVARDNAKPSPSTPVLEIHGPVFVCFVRRLSPDCSARFYPNAKGYAHWQLVPFHFLDARIVYAHPGQSAPRLLLKVCSAEAFDGNCSLATALYGYQRASDRFSRLFLNARGRNNNEETRFMTHGPLQGDVIVNYPTRHAPYTYWIEVYQPAKAGNYVRVLRYRGHTGYNDGNPMAVIDSEMPEILLHMGLWHPGAPLPVPSHLPEGCKHLVLRHQEEWCSERLPESR